MFLTVLVGELPRRPLPGRLRRQGRRAVSQPPQPPAGSCTRAAPAGGRSSRWTTSARTSTPPAGVVRAVDGVTLHPRARQDARHRRRVRLRQDRAVPLDHGPAHRPQRRAQRARRRYDGQELVGAAHSRAARALGHRDGDGLPGPDDLAQPGDADRAPDHRGAALPPRHARRTRPTQQALQLLESVGIPDPKRRLDAVPPRAVRRHAPAGHDRHRAGLRPEAPVRRRAHHRARRHRAGPDPRTCSTSSSASATWPWCSSPTTSAWSPAAPTRSP